MGSPDAYLAPAKTRGRRTLGSSFAGLVRVSATMGTPANGSKGLLTHGRGRRPCSPPTTCAWIASSTRLSAAAYPARSPRCWSSGSTRWEMPSSEKSRGVFGSSSGTPSCAPALRQPPTVSHSLAAPHHSAGRGMDQLTRQASLGSSRRCPTLSDAASSAEWIKIPSCSNVCSFCMTPCTPSSADRSRSSSELKPTGLRGTRGGSVTL